MPFMHEDERLKTSLFATSREKQGKIEAVAKTLSKDVGRKPNLLPCIFKTCRSDNIANSEFADCFVDCGNLLPYSLAIFILITVECGTTGMLSQNLRGAPKDRHH